jgi:hypothetical protein
MHKILEAVKRLDTWVGHNGWAGWDPYDIQNNVLMRWLGAHTDGLIRKKMMKIMTEAMELFPLGTRKILHIKPKVNAKGMGLFLTAYASLYEVTQDEGYLARALTCAAWLIQHRNRNYSGWSWGYPFDWQSIRYIPRDTPSSIVTATVGDGFFLIYRITREVKYLDICKGICEFFLDNLRITYKEKDTICYSYTPIDNYQVHNANLHVGEFLARIGLETGNSSLVDCGINCGNFAVKQQQAEGYLPYWGLDQTHSHSNGKMRTDHYHSGFEIRMLYKLWKHTGVEVFRECYLKYFRWYLANMFLSDCYPKMNPASFYPINIHSCAESLLCRSVLLPDHPERLSGILRTFDWILAELEYAPGCYTYLIKKYPAIGKLKIKIAMVRWGQAWMLRAYGELLKSLVLKSDPSASGYQEF